MIIFKILETSLIFAVKANQIRYTDEESMKKCIRFNFSTFDENNKNSC